MAPVDATGAAVVVGSAAAVSKGSTEPGGERAGSGTVATGGAAAATGGEAGRTVSSGVAFSAPASGEVSCLRSRTKPPPTTAIASTETSAQRRRRSLPLSWLHSETAETDAWIVGESLATGPGATELGRRPSAA